MSMYRVFKYINFILLKFVSLKKKKYFSFWIKFKLKERYIFFLIWFTNIQPYIVCVKGQNNHNSFFIQGDGWFVKPHTIATRWLPSICFLKHILSLIFVTLENSTIFTTSLKLICTTWVKSLVELSRHYI